MPWYYFDVRDGKGFHPDDIGDEFDNFEEARAQAQELLPDIAGDEMPDSELYQVSCDVRDDKGATVYRGELTYRGTRLLPVKPSTFRFFKTYYG